MTKRRRGDQVEFDFETGCWLVPLSDSLLNLLSDEWSEPVRLRLRERDGEPDQIEVRYADTFGGSLEDAD